MKEILFFDSPDFKQVITVENKVYTLGFTWNTRWSHWSMTISDTDGVIVAGVRLVMGFLLLADHGSSRLPRGDFFLLQMRPGIDEPGRNNIGIDKDFSLYFIEMSDGII